MTAALPQALRASTPTNLLFSMPEVVEVQINVVVEYLHKRDQHIFRIRTRRRKTQLPIALQSSGTTGTGQVALSADSVTQVH